MSWLSETLVELCRLQCLGLKRRKSSQTQSQAARRGSKVQRARNADVPACARDGYPYTNTTNENNTIIVLRNEHNRHPYVHLDPDARDFRLFVLEQSPSRARVTGQLERWSLGNHPTYQALSYTWGNLIYRDGVHPRSTIDRGDLEIRVDGRPFLVSRNLHQALLRLRHVHGPRYLWIDAICINQNDVEEKNHQVGLMRHIYTEAISVIAWLGPSNRHSSSFMQLVNDITLAEDRPRRLQLIQDALQNREYNFEATCCDFFRRSYWYRTWIIQEVYFARGISVQCDPRVASWEDLAAFQAFLRDEGSVRDKVQLQAMERLISHTMRFRVLDTLRKSRPRSRPGRSNEPRPYPLARLLFDHWDALATNARDKIFAIKDLASDSRLYNIDVDYRLSVREVYTNFVREHIRLSGNLGIIIPRRPQTRTHNLPSWCVDLSSTVSESGDAFKDTYPFLTLSRSYHASTETPSDIDTQFTVQFSACVQVMMAGGWNLGRVHDISDRASIRDFQPPKKGLFDFSDLPLACGIVPSQAPSELSEIEIWYSMHRRGLPRGFEAEHRRGLFSKVTARLYPLLQEEA